jgi:hypothetical protein
VLALLVLVVALLYCRRRKQQQYPNKDSETLMYGPSSSHGCVIANSSPSPAGAAWCRGKATGRIAPLQLTKLSLAIW